MQETSIFWLRTAAVLYSIGVIHTLLVLLRRNSPLFRGALGALGVGVIFHLVSIVERGMLLKRVPLDNFFETASICGFLVAVVFLFVHWRYDFSSLGIGIFPLVFMLTQLGALELPVSPWSNAGVRGAGLAVHVFLILLGYAALLLMTFASVFYLIQERALKNKRPSVWFDRLPPLATLDSLITRSMGLGFTFITLGLVSGLVWAFIESGTKFLFEERIGFAFVTWGAYLIMVFLRASAGLRGRKAAWMALTVLGCSTLTWIAHIGLRPLLEK
jgi:ABC-type uncharacterized transport system permease subunit